jgi:KipI family sensor histidine kinase inhibitor
LISPPRIRPLGDSALTVEFAESLSVEANLKVRALDAVLARNPPEGFREAVPTLRSLLVLYDGRRGFERFREALLALAGDAAPPPPGRSHEIPTLYGGEGGPDLYEVARKAGLSEADVVHLHGAREYTAFMVGFTPGFAYLGSLDPRLETARRTTPRVRVPAGSVGIASTLTGIYPVVSAGGWNLLGLTRLGLFDPGADDPVRIRPGDRVRFVPTRDLPPFSPRTPAAPQGAPALEILEGGLLTTIQARPRAGYRRVGVAAAGPLDPRAHASANRLLGNPDDAPALEVTLTGPTLRFLAGAHFALTGADFGAVLERSDLGEWPCPRGAPVRARAGNVLHLAKPTPGALGYLAFSGGIASPEVLGSGSTDLVGGFGGVFGRALKAGDRLALNWATPRSPAEPAPEPDRKGVVEVRVVLGPQEEDFAAEGLARFLGQTFSLSAECNRVGLRLQGSPIPHARGGEIASDGMVPGSIQVPPSGLPIVMLQDCPTTGGYPKIATVVSADLPRLARIAPGTGRLRFLKVNVEEAQALLFPPKLS